MKKEQFCFWDRSRWLFRLFLTVKVLLLSVSFLLAQQRTDRVSITMKNASLTDVFEQIKRETGMSFMYSNDDVRTVRARDYSVTLTTIPDAVRQVLQGTGLESEFTNGVMVVRKATSQTTSMPLTQPSVVRGTVKDNEGLPVPGASVVVKGTTLGVATDREGRFELRLPEGQDVVIVISFIGMQSQEIRYRGESELNIIMIPEIMDISEVIVTGIFTRRAESFTGAATTFKQEDLRRFGNQNVLQSLKNLDPSFALMDNIDYGSDPNRLPDIQIRGASSLPNVRGEYQSNPNQPLFILDGFEASMQKVFDLDMNRVASVTLLKDAAAKAIYGSRAANGVVVIETILPEKGKLKVSYAADLNITGPDLTSYDLCSASEKLEVEWNAGRYVSFYPIDYQLRLEQYNLLKEEIARGVETYWLAKPLRTGVGHKHALFLEGGDDYLRYGIDLSYNNVAGVMKGSSRENISGAITLSYRHKNVVFRNTLNVTFNKANDSPYGQFSEYTRLNSYWAPEDENGNLKRVLGSFQTAVSANPTLYYNPLYNATLGTKNFSEYTEVTNNFYAEWQVREYLKLIGRFGYTQNKDSREDFYPGNHSRFYDWVGDRYFKRGEYAITEGKNTALKADLTLNYNRQWNKHLLFANANWNLRQETSDSHGMQAWGFLNDKVDHVAFAKQYADNGKPSGSEARTREIGLIAAANYSYDDRYLADFSYRGSGSSIYGSDNRWGSFWSLGAGWNVHNEDFASEWNWMKQLKIRGSIGYTGSQNFNPYQAMATYNFFTDVEYDNVVGAYLMGLANDRLKWQQTRDINLGLDMQLLRGLSFRFDYYVSNTDNLLIDFSMPGSSGFLTYKENLGEVQNKGFDGSISWRLYNNPSKSSYFTLFGSIAGNQNKIVKISDALMRSNNDQNDPEKNKEMSKPYTRFEEGQSTSAIWAVRSMGIDPATGREIFLDRDGNKTYNWNINDQVVCGEANPKVRGNFGFNTEYKGFALNCAFSYRLGGDYYNQTLVNRVENVDVQYNVDHRVFSGTWNNPGDVTFFKRITASPTTTRPTDRFVEKQNEVSLASVNFSYDFKRLAFAKTLERMKLSFYMVDVFRISTVEAERGLEYPFARTYSFSLQMTF